MQKKKYNSAYKKLNESYLLANDLVQVINVVKQNLVFRHLNQSKKIIINKNNIL